MLCQFFCIYRCMTVDVITGTIIDNGLKEVINRSKDKLV